MDTKAFNSTFDGILSLNEKEGPNRNLFEPKFQAREQAEKLLISIKNAFKDTLPVGTGAEGNDDESSKSSEDEALKEILEKNSEPLLRAQWQIVRLLIFLGNNAHELEDDKDAERTLLLAATIAIKTSNKKYIFSSQKSFSADLIPALTLPEILKLDSSSFASPATRFFGIQWTLDCLNSLGVFLSARMEASERIGDAVCVLHKVEDLFTAFNSWAKEHDSDTTSLRTIPWKDAETNELDLSSIPEDQAEARERILRRMHMEQRFCNTLFYLAQGYGLRGDQDRSSKYAFLTMVHQLLCRKDFSKKDWATNAVHLSNFFNAEEEWAYAHHCLEAAQKTMPSETRSEDTTGVVNWGFGKFFKAKLKAAVVAKNEKERAEKEGRPAPGPRATPGELAGIGKWWQNLPLKDLAPPQKDVWNCEVTTFEQARDLFKKGTEYLQKAAEDYPYDGACTDYIEIQIDIATLYNYLSDFEPQLDRKIAMQLRRVELLEKFPKDLNFDSYTRHIRQLYFDLGDIVSDIVDLRHEQRTQYVKDCQEIIKNNLPKKKPPHGSNDKALNELVQKGQGLFNDFIETYREKNGPNKGNFPARFEAEALPALLRAKMRIARLEGRYSAPTPEMEYHMVGRMKEKYAEVSKFANEQEVLKHDQSLRIEVQLAHDMQPVLDGKQRDIHRTFAGKK